MAVIKVESRMVDVVVFGSANADHLEKEIPRVSVFNVQQHELIRIQRTKGHKLPIVDMNVDQREELAGDEQRHQYLKEGVGHGTAEGIEKSRVDELVVLLVGNLVERNDNVFQKMGNIDQEIHNEKLHEDVEPTDRRVKIIV